MQKDAHAFQGLTKGSPGRWNIFPGDRLPAGLKVRRFRTINAIISGPEGKPYQSRRGLLTASENTNRPSPSTKVKRQKKNNRQKAKRREQAQKVQKFRSLEPSLQDSLHASQKISAPQQAAYGFKKFFPKAISKHAATPRG